MSSISTTVAGLRALTSADSTAIYQTTDYGGGQWYYDPSSSLTDNLGTVLVNENGDVFRRIYEGPINALWFGAVGDGVTDDTAAIQNAIDALDGEGTIFIPSPINYYLFLSSLTITRNVALSGEKPDVLLDFTNLAANETAITINAGTISALGEYESALSNLILVGSYSALNRGVDYPDTSGDFTPGTYGLQLNTQNLVLDNVMMLGFEYGVGFGSNAYLINFKNATFRYCNYGIYFDATDKTNLGENIAFNNCVIGNNINGIYNYLGELNLIACSLDYNQIHIYYNQTKYEGVISSKLSLIGCHLETGENEDASPKIINTGTLLISGGSIWSETNTGGYFSNTGEAELNLISVQLRTPDTINYYVSGNRPITNYITYISDSQLVRMHSTCGYVPNGDFEDNTLGLSHWVISEGTAVISTDKAEIGTQSLKVTSLEYNGGQVTSPTIFLPQDKREIYVSLFVNNYDSSGAGFYNINEFDSTSTFIQATSIYIPLFTTDDFYEVFSNWYLLSPLTQSISIELNTAAGTSNVAYFDGIYVWAR
jgi:hypothetical protein